MNCKYFVSLGDARNWLLIYHAKYKESRTIAAMISENKVINYFV